MSPHPPIPQSSSEHKESPQRNFAPRVMEKRTEPQQASVLWTSGSLCYRGLPVFTNTDPSWQLLGVSPRHLPHLPSPTPGALTAVKPAPSSVSTRSHSPGWGCHSASPSAVQELALLQTPPSAPGWALPHQYQSILLCPESSPLCPRSRLTHHCLATLLHHDTEAR